MLSVIPTIVFNSSEYSKCAEILCRNESDFTIRCAFCEIKTFEYEDFLRHLKNIHFEENVLKTRDEYDKSSISRVNRKIEDGTKIGSNLIEGHNVDQTTDNLKKYEILESELEANINEDSCVVEDKSLKKMSTKGTIKADWSDEENDDNENEDVEDTDFIPSKRIRKVKNSIHLEVHKCDKCEKEYKTLNQFKKHQLREHFSENHNPPENASNEVKCEESFTCSECNEVYLNKRKLDNHCIKIHNGIKCDKCDKRFVQRYYLTRHMETHIDRDIKNFLCDFGNCTKRFYTQRRLGIHKRSHTAPKNFICDVCGYGCQIQETLRVHYRRHTGEKPYECSVCQKRFYSSSLLSEHKASHSTERPHVCDVCGATFARPKALYHHKHLHLGIKKFVCKVCGNAYAQAAGLAGHMRRHKEDGLI